MHLRGGGGLLVELRQGGSHDVGLAGQRAFRRLGDQLHTVHHASAPHLENLNHGASGAQLQAEHIARRQVGRGHLLVPVLERLHRAQRITQLPGLFVPFVCRGLCHARAQLARQFLRAPFEKQSRGFDRPAVLAFRAQGVHTRRDTAMDVVFEAGAPTFARDHLVARTDAEQPMRQRHRPACQLRRQKRPGIHVTVLLDPTSDEHPREPLGRRELEIRVVLVVAQQDVVFRAALLDQVVLERQRLHHRVGDDHLQARDLVEQRVGPRAHAPGAEVAADAVAEGPGLADVQGVATLVEIQVDARLFGQARDLGLEIVDRHQLHCRVGALNGEPLIIATLPTHP